MLRKILTGTAILALIGVVAGYWLVDLFTSSEQAGLAATTSAELIYLEGAVPENRGKILAVVTSTAEMGDSGKRTGYELTELSRAYYVFTANGFEVDIASPLGGRPPVVIDDDDLGKFDYAFINDIHIRQQLANTLPLDHIDPKEYSAVYFVGGKGAMWDFPDNRAIQRIVAQLHRDGKVVGAVCHGPAALVNVRLDSGEFLVSGKRMSGFTNEEELFLIPESRQVFPFLLEDKLRAHGAVFEAGPTYLEQVSQDSRLVTGQNPWSVWTVAEDIVRQLGYQPIPRQKTAEEYSTKILATYEHHGFRRARAQLDYMRHEQNIEINYHLIAMHSLIAAMRLELVKALELVVIASSAKTSVAEI